MQVAYFPGCTLSTKAIGYDRSGRAVAAALDISLTELPGWQCCGATFPLAADNTMAFIAPARLLNAVQQAGETVTTLCAVCFHVLKRTQFFLAGHPEVQERINWFTEETYQGRSQVTHFLELLRDQVGWAALAGQVKRPLRGLKVAPYYGCLLLRPENEIGLDDPDQPTILGDCLAALGCEVVDFPYQVECCGSYLAVSKPELPEKLSQEIVAAARRRGAQAIATACPLCQFNLDYAQRERVSVSANQRRNPGGDELPIVYFTQLMAVALGLEEAAWGLTGHYVDPAPLLRNVL